MRAISSVRLERAAHNGARTGGYPPTHTSPILLPVHSGSMSNRFVLGSNPRWPIRPAGTGRTSSALWDSGTGPDVRLPLVREKMSGRHPTKERVVQSLGSLNGMVRFHAGQFRESRLAWSILDALGASDESSNLFSPTWAGIPYHCHRLRRKSSGFGHPQHSSFFKMSASKEAFASLSVREEHRSTANNAGDREGDGHLLRYARHHIKLPSRMSVRSQVWSKASGLRPLGTDLRRFKSCRTQLGWHPVITAELLPEFLTRFPNPLLRVGSANNKMGLFIDSECDVTTSPLRRETNRRFEYSGHLRVVVYPCSLWWSRREFNISQMALRLLGAKQIQYGEQAKTGTSADG